MIHQVRAWEAQILRLTFRPRMKPNETWVTCRIRTSRSMRTSWKKMSLSLLTEKIASKIWTTMTWPCMTVMSQLCWLFVPFWGGEQLRGGETGHLEV